MGKGIVKTTVNTGEISGQYDPHSDTLYIAIGSSDFTNGLRDPRGAFVRFEIDKEGPTGLVVTRAKRDGWLKDKEAFAEAMAPILGLTADQLSTLFRYMS